MKKIAIGSSRILSPQVIIGCMRFADFTKEQMQELLHFSLAQGANSFDHADIYGNGKSEEIFGAVLKECTQIDREQLILQSKCGIRFEGKGFYDLSKEHIIASVDQSLKRLQTEYLDILLLHRPDALVEPEEVAEAFDQLKAAGKVRYFGVSNHKPAQIELLKKYVTVPLEINQLQFSLPVSNMVANGMEVNMDSPGSVDHDGSVLDYCRLKDLTIQAWSPFQMPNWQGCFLGSDQYKELNVQVQELADSYGVTPTTIAAAWILRHPAKMQIITGTTNQARLQEIFAAMELTLTREEWYKLYLAAGHPLP